ncbi:hypothetical protein 10S9_23 [uncultured Caudovirales phage]|uniref:Uncharacterized protein n=1 Tax=uncultured Caudovirales phage TaxID=2100421 RepID=A0A2H4JAD1_9CAUD|nr:hypothetical protein 10S9_23 [uncultured Caudovirales phage]
MKKAYFTVGDLKEFLESLNEETEVFVSNTFNLVGNISELAEARLDTYSSFGIVSPCVILDTAQNVEFDEED